MEDTHICIGDLAKKFGYNVISDEAISFYGVSHLSDFVNCLLS
jgi:protein phosphatase 2C family protein 2/3